MKRIVKEINTCYDCPECIRHTKVYDNKVIYHYRCHNIKGQPYIKPTGSILIECPLED